MKLRKIVTSAVALTLSAAMLASCADHGDKKRTTRHDDDEEIEISEETTVETTETTAETTSAPVETVAEVPAEDNLYEKFLKNETTVKINGSGDKSGMGLLADIDGQEMTLEALTNLAIASFSNEYTSSDLGGISYSYIDCGMDGQQELVISICVSSADLFDEIFVIKDFGGELRTVYTDAAWSRSHFFINEYGYMDNDGSGGAAYHVYDKSYIDAEGNYHFIYGDESTTSLEMGLFYDGNNISLPIDEGSNYAFLSFWFEEGGEAAPDSYSFISYSDGSFIDTEGGYGNYFYCVRDDDDSLYDESNGIYSALVDNGIEITPIGTIEQRIADKETAEGLTPEIKAGAPAQWNPLDITFQPVIPGLDSENFIGCVMKFPLFFKNGNSHPEITIQSDGSCKGSYAYFHQGEPADKNEFTGTFTFVSKVSDNVYEIKLDTYDLTYEAGTTNDSGDTNYVEIPHLAKDITYTLYLKGSSVDEIGEDLIAMLPDYAREERIKDGEITVNMLVCREGEGGIWYQDN